MDQLWQRLEGRTPALLALILLVLTQIIALALPQIPVSPRQSTSFNRWLAELRPQLGPATRPLASLGLLTIRSSALLRLVLAFLGLIVAATLDRLRESWHTRSWRSGHTARLLVCIGGVLIIGGWAGQMLGGWREPEVVVWPDDQIEILGRDLVIDQPSGPIGLWPGGYGRYVMTRGNRLGLEVQAAGAEGEALPLLPAVNEAPVDALRLTFTTQEPEAFFAIPKAELVFRLNQVEQAIQVQAYRSASGELLTETLLQAGDATTVLQLGAASVSITQTLLPRYEVIYNPGAGFEGLGLALLALGVISRTAHIPEQAGEPSEPEGAGQAADHA
ncbi:MAG: hypothetical protein MUF84_14520 [Anaerolineae bacterium]|nr:hypothetical protein [Anaerolineae bacterium]